MTVIIYDNGEVYTIDESEIYEPFPADKEAEIKL